MRTMKKIKDQTITPEEFTSSKIFAPLLQDKRLEGALLDVEKDFAEKTI